MKYRYILIILIILVLSGCAADQPVTPSTDDSNPGTESTDTSIINAKRIEQFKNYIDENQIFDVFLADNIATSSSLYRINYSPLTYELTYDATSITIKAQSVLPYSEDPELNTMVISLDENNNIQYTYSYIYYDVFEYYKGKPLQPYQAHLKYYHDSDGNSWLKLNCYWKYIYQLEYDQANASFINADPKSDGYGQKMVFKSGLSYDVNASYLRILDDAKIFEQNLNALGWYAKSLFIATSEN